MIVNGYAIGPAANLRGAALDYAGLGSADLSYADLRGAKLHAANLRYTKLRGADLRGAELDSADLSYADLSVADLRGADLCGADLRGAKLDSADLGSATLRGADLHVADLRYANLSGAHLHHTKNIPSLPATIIVPEGELIVYKMGSKGIVTLKIPHDALRSNGSGRKCRASKAIVVDCPKGSRSKYDRSFAYNIGDTVTPTKPFDMDRWNECGSGIHFFLTRWEAENY